ncbi:MAG: YlxR family protein [Propionibacteriaceae bacterium]|nr:YlxR family protein [Propionibacteriaceae bacterium]
MCVGCREREPASRLVRLAWDGATGQVVLDPGRRRPGRGVHLHAGCVARVIRNAGVGRGLRRPVDPEQVRQLLEAVSQPRLGDSGSRR